MSAPAILSCRRLISHAVSMGTSEKARHLHIDCPSDLFERIGVIAGRTGVSRLAWIIAALTEAEAAASWRFDAITRLATVLADDDELRTQVCEAYLAHEDVTLRALLEEVLD